MPQEVVYAIGFLAIIWYYYCIFYLGFLEPVPRDGNKQFRDFVKLSIPALSGTLATFAGLLLCLKPLEGTEGVPRVTWFGWGALAAYIASLVVALIAWSRNGDKTDPAIIALAKLFLGLIGGVLAVALNL